MQPRRPIRTDLKDRTAAPFPGAGGRLRGRLAAFNLRDWWWRLLDFFEASRARRVLLYAAAVLIVGGLAARQWAYPWWARRNAIQVAQRWLDAGQLRNAAEAAARASQLAPDRPEPWAIASELARLGHQEQEALRYARRAVELAPDDFPLGVTLAAAALRAGETTEAESVLARLPAAEVAQSAAALRIRGELARRALRLSAARDAFTAAARLEPTPVNEVPLGMILLRSREPAERRRGLDLLARWTADPAWGLPALRTLLADAQEQNETAAMLRWAEALRAHPGCTVADIPRWLQALALAAPHKFAAALAGLEKDHAVAPEPAAQLIGWLNQIGRSEEAVAWVRTLPAPGSHRPPVIVVAAESFRATQRWAELQEWLDASTWTPDTEFVKWLYALEAARQRGDDPRAEELLRTLDNHGKLHTGHALFAASTLYGWGRTREAETLWWRAAEQEGSNAFEALGALARHYQVTRDADGQYRAFRRLHGLKPKDAAIGNNFAFFALLTGREQRLAEQVARQNHDAEPANVSYLATLAFALTQQGRFSDALTLLQPQATLAASSPALAFSRGLALAGAGRTAEARALLEPIPPASLTLAEVALIKQSLER